jgi:hypothetical protein
MSEYWSENLVVINLRSPKGKHAQAAGMTGGKPVSITSNIVQQFGRAKPRRF